MNAFYIYFMLADEEAESSSWCIENIKYLSGSYWASVSLLLVYRTNGGIEILCTSIGLQIVDKIYAVIE
jgi:hypothetical protein